jgi:hypothetical protein
MKTYKNYNNKNKYKVVINKLLFINFIHEKGKTKPVKIINEVKNTTPVENFTNNFNNLFGHFFIFKRLHMRRIFLKRFQKNKKARRHNLGKASHINKVDWETNYQRLHKENREDFFYNFFGMQQKNYTENIERLFFFKLYTTTKNSKNYHYESDIDNVIINE